MAVIEKRLSPSQEDYLEAILVLVRQGKPARVRDIAGALGVSMPSVSAALRALAERKLVHYDPYEYVTLTPGGDEIARQVVGRHENLQRFLSDVLGLDSPVSAANACRMEHAVDDVVLQRFSMLADFVASNATVAEAWARYRAHHRAAKAPEPPAGDGAASARRPASADGVALSGISTGHEVAMVSITGGRALQHRLAELGLLPGCRFKVLKGGHGGPLVVSVKDTRLMLGADMVRRIMVRRVNAESKAKA